jgi:hypothetical protein
MTRPRHAGRYPARIMLSEKPLLCRTPSPVRPERETFMPRPPCTPRRYRRQLRGRTHTTVIQIQPRDRGDFPPPNPSRDTSPLACPSRTAFRVHLRSGRRLAGRRLAESRSSARVASAPVADVAIFLNPARKCRAIDIAPVNPGSASRARNVNSPVADVGGRWGCLQLATGASPWSGGVHIRKEPPEGAIAARVRSESAHAPAVGREQASTPHLTHQPAKTPCLGGGSTLPPAQTSEVAHPRRRPRFNQRSLLSAA